MRTPEKHAAVDEAWLKDQLRRREMMQHDLAALIDVSPATMSKIVRGVRPIKVQEARKLSDSLKVPVDEIMRRFGVEVPPHTMVPIIGYLLDDCSVTPAPEPRESVEVPPGVGRDGCAVQVRSPRAAGSIWDGMVCYLPTLTPVHPSEALGELALVHLPDGASLMGILSRGYHPNTYNLTHPIAPSSRENLALSNAIPSKQFRRP